MKIMRNSVLITSAALLACTLAMPLGAKDKKQVMLPIKGAGVMTVHYTPISPTTAFFHNEEDGHMTFAGLYHNVGDGTTDFSTGATLTGSGTVTAANGDTIHWVLDSGSRYLVVGGTGRFENASGDMTWTLLSKSDPVFFRDGTFEVTILAAYEGEVTF